MSFYRFILHIRWSDKIEFHHRDDINVYSVLGAYTTRKVYSFTNDKAVSKAKENALKELEEKFYTATAYPVPKVDIDTMSEISLLDFFFSRTPNKGFSFYSDD